MDSKTLIGRAQSGLGKNTVYASPGVTPPLAAATWPASGAKCDCSGFLAWCLRISRAVDHPKYKAINGGWFETTGIHADVQGNWGFFEHLDTPRPGAFVVYPDYIGSDGKSHDGHIGLITSVNGKAGVQGIKTVIHCSYGGWKNHGDAIRETDPAAWLAKTNSAIGWHTSITA